MSAPQWMTAVGTAGVVPRVQYFSSLDTFVPDPVLTDTMREGDPQYVRSVGDFLFPSIGVGAPFIRIPIHGGGEQYLRHNTERGFRQEFTEVDLTVETRTFGYASFGVRAGIDIRERTLSDARFRRVENLVRLLAEALRIDREVIRYDLLADANFPPSHVIDLTGSEWNSGGGDSAGDLQAGLDILRLAYPWVDEQHVQLTLTFQARRAALGDPTYLAAKTNIAFQKASLEEWISYAARDYARVNVGDLLVKFDENSTEGPLWGATAILSIVDDPKADLDESFGMRRFAAEHRFNDGSVSQSWFDPSRTTEWRSASLSSRQFVHAINRAVKFTNVLL